MRVLGAFAVSQPNTGYCQSMNFVAAFLLIIFDKNEVKKIQFNEKIQIPPSRLFLTLLSLKMSFFLVFIQ